MNDPTGRSRPWILRPGGFDWDVRAALRRQRLSLTVAAIGVLAGVALIATGWTLAGVLLLLAGGLSFVGRVVVGMIEPPS